ncbi:ras guanine nucleotide exchange factor domain-containing protein, partial [Endogone sp. FLAS-F59071]
MDSTLPKVDRSSTSSSNSGLSHNELGEPALEASLANVAPQPLPRSPSRMTNGYRRKNLLDPNEPLTWSKLAANIALSIHNLNTSAKVVQRNLFVPHASAIVESIRHMLYASGTIEKESPLIKANKTLKVHHRAIMASLSKLVLSAKLASGVWPPPDAIAKMQSDANEVLVAVRDFVNTAQAIGIEVRHVDPRLVPGVQNWRQRNGVGNSGRRSSASNGAKDGQSSRYSLQQDLHNNLELYARNMAKSLTLLITHAKNAAERPTQGFRSSANNPLNAATPLLIAQFRNLSTQISQFINIVEDIYIDDTLPSVGEFRLSKQSLYNAVGYLFNATQNVTDPNTPESVSKAVDSATRKVEESLWDVCDSVKGMILERQEKLKAPAPAPVGPAPVPEGHVNGDGPYVRRGSNPESSNGHSLNHNKQRSRSISGFSSGIGSRDGGASTVDTLPEEEEEADAPHFPDIVSNDGTASRSQHIYSDEDEAYDDVMADESTEDGGIMSPPVRKYRSSRREPRNNNDDDENISSDSDVSQRSSMHEGAIASIPPHLRKRSESNANSVSSEPTSASGFPAGPQRSMTGPPGDFLITGAGQKSPRGDKLKKFFGVDHVQDGGPVRTPARDEKPWYLGYDYPPSEMVLNMEGYVKGGTLTALVERLTLHDYLDSNFINTFLLTYRSFCTTKEFFDLLVKRFTMEPPQGLTSEELENWEEKKRKPVRLRVSNIIKNWVENYYNEDEDSEVLENIREFASTTMQEKLPITAMPLIKLIDKRTMKKLVPNSIAAAPAPMLPKNMKRFRFLDVDPLELARQLTIMDSRLYTKIKPVECLDKAWSCEDSENEAVNVKACIEYHNQVTAWVSDSILSQGEVKKRTAIIKHWVQVAEKCRILNNFNTCMAILASFDSSAIGRLKRTWETVTQRTMQTLAYIRKLMGTNKNFNEYREIIKKINPPCIPFLGIYLQDLTFIEDGNTGFLKKSKTLINFSKRMKTAEVIRDIQVYQSTPYLLHPIPEIQVFIKTHLTSSRDDVTLYELSLQLEP